METHDDIPAIALGWHDEGRGAAIATVVETWGSAPRPVGSLLAISGGGEIAGSVSGGCVEGAVICEARAAIADGQPRLLRYGVSDDAAFSAGLACGGTIRVLVEPVGKAAPALPAALLRELVAARAARRPVAMITDTESWARRLAGPDEGPENGPENGPDDLPARFRADRSGLAADGRTFVTIHNPPLRLIVVGAVHIAQALIPMARLAGFDVSLIDPRATFATPERFPGVTIHEDYPDEVLTAADLDPRVAVVTLSHDPKIDDPMIELALAGAPFYLGCLGSTRTHAKRLDRLAGRGIDAAALARIHAPVGLDIGAKSPAEIAVSIIAEIVRRLRQG